MMNKIFRCKERKIVFEKASHSFEILINCIGQMVGGLVGPFFFVYKQFGWLNNFTLFLHFSKGIFTFKLMLQFVK